MTDTFKKAREAIIRRSAPLLQNCMWQPNFNADTQDEDGNTILHIMAIWQVDTMIWEILKYNPDPFIKNKKGETARDITKDQNIKNILRLYENNYNSKYNKNFDYANDCLDTARVTFEKIIKENVSFYYDRMISTIEQDLSTYGVTGLTGKEPSDKDIADTKEAVQQVVDDCFYDIYEELEYGYADCQCVECQEAKEAV